MSENVVAIPNNEIPGPLRRFATSTPERISADRKTKKRFTSYVNGLSGAFQRIERLLRESPKFFTAQNHREALKLARPDEVRMMRAPEWDDATGLPVRVVPKPVRLSPQQVEERARQEAERKRDEAAGEREEEANVIRSYFKRQAYPGGRVARVSCAEAQRAPHDFSYLPTREQPRSIDSGPVLYIGCTSDARCLSSPAARAIPGGE